jgi:hypothetical protein
LIARDGIELPTHGFSDRLLRSLDIRAAWFY